MIAGPLHQLLDLVPGMTVEDGAERLLEIVEGIDAVQLAGRHEGGEHGPVFSVHIVAREERILSCEGNWSDEILDGVGIKLKATVFEEAGETSPEPERVGDVGSQLRLCRDLRRLSFEPGLELLDDGGCMCPARLQADLR